MNANEPNHAVINYPLIAEAKRLLPLPQLLAKIGDEAHAKKSARCPFHEDGRNSFSVYRARDGAWLWKCHAGCGAGDDVDYLAKRFNLSTGDAIRRYYQETGLNGTPKLTPKSRAAFDWEKCVNAFTEDATRDLAEWRRLSPGFISWLHSQRMIGLHNGAFAFAVHDLTGRVVGCHALVYRAAKIWNYVPRGKGARPLIFGDVSKARTLFLFESQWDALSVMDRLGWHTGDGLPNTAVLITRGGENGKLIAGRCSAGAVAYAFVQNDNPKANGRIPAEDWLAAVVAHAGCKVLRVTTPAPHKDAND